MKKHQFVKKLKVSIKFLIVEMLPEIGFEDFSGVIGNLLFNRRSDDGKKLYQCHQYRFRHGGGILLTQTYTIFALHTHTV
jgi:hypothetical protein